MSQKLTTFLRSKRQGQDFFEKKARPPPLSILHAALPSFSWVTECLSYMFTLVWSLALSPHGFLYCVSIADESGSVIPQFFVLQIWCHFFSCVINLLISTVFLIESLVVLRQKTAVELMRLSCGFPYVSFPSIFLPVCIKLWFSV